MCCEYQAFVVVSQLCFDIIPSVGRKVLRQFLVLNQFIPYHVLISNEITPVTFKTAKQRHTRRLRMPSLSNHTHSNDELKLKCSRNYENIFFELMEFMKFLEFTVENSKCTQSTTMPRDKRCNWRRSKGRNHPIRSFRRI